MRVLSVIHYPVFGGPHNRNRRIIPHLHAAGCETVVLLPDDAGNAAPYLRKHGIEVVQMKLSRVRATMNPLDHLGYFCDVRSDVARIRRVIREYRIDVVQINGLVNVQAGIAAKQENVPVVWQILDTYAPMTLRRIIMPIVRRYADVLMVTGRKVGDEHPGSETFGDRLVHFFPPVDLSLFTPNSEGRTAARRALGIAPDARVIGTVGNINRQKGHHTFVRAAASLLRKSPNTRFVILGASHATHSKHEESMRREAEALGMSIGKDLIVRDPQGRVHELAHAFDIFWMTSEPRSEGIPTAIEEAMALGLPVISTEVGSISEIVFEGRTGFVVSPHDSETIASRTSYILENEKVYLELSRNAVDFAAKFSVNACAERHLYAYRLALGQA